MDEQPKPEPAYAALGCGDRWLAASTDQKYGFILQQGRFKAFSDYSQALDYLAKNQHAELFIRHAPKQGPSALFRVMPSKLGALIPPIAEQATLLEGFDPYGRTMYLQLTGKPGLAAPLESPKNLSDGSIEYQDGLRAPAELLNWRPAQAPSPAALGAGLRKRRNSEPSAGLQKAGSPEFKGA